jgi:hypothetical protein
MFVLVQVGFGPPHVERHDVSVKRKKQIYRITVTQCMHPGGIEKYISM